MGDIVEMTESGVLCFGCGAYVDGREPGHRRECDDCIEESQLKEQGSK